MQARKRDGDDQEVGALVILVDQVIGLFQPKLNSSGGVALFPPVGYLLVWGALGLFYPPFELVVILALYVGSKLLVEVVGLNESDVDNDLALGAVLAASSGPGPTSSYVVTLPAGGTEAIASPSFSALNHLLIFVGGFAVALVVLKNANEMDGDEGLVNGDQSSPIEEESNPNKILMNLWDENFAPSKIRKSEDDEEVDDDNDSQKYVINSLYSSATEPFAEGNRFLPINQSTTSFVCL
eukprot:CAMPEP_0168763866 /NCGR_PEP_ID=MMETSP0724-20121128/24584_1 /TAXON_ID=265536 /ORGANISM="Amphiprora sp., Strain CCMP467" /LENGTH=238 /DNA_ID=CAMNT_0008813083 /DNA_START=167 /DNA_END=884 /DNA_ORIENTATION=+